MKRRVKEGLGMRKEGWRLIKRCLYEEIERERQREMGDEGRKV